MTHDYHQILPDYSPAQILHDGCSECEARSTRPDHGISSLDRENFLRAWQRATQFQRTALPDVSRAEAPLLEALISVQIKLENFGVPFGALPAVAL